MRSEGVVLRGGGWGWNERRDDARLEEIRGLVKRWGWICERCYVVRSFLDRASHSIFPPKMERAMKRKRREEGAQLNAGKDVVLGSCNAVAGVVW